MLDTKVRPPYVVFESRPQVDGQLTAETGYPVYKDVIFALISPIGSRDRVEKIASDWLQEIATKSRNGDSSWPHEFIRHFNACYNAFIAEQEPPLLGTSVKNWPAITQSQVKQILGANIKSIEDLATANEQSLSRIGMGGRALKEKALSWLESANNGAKVATDNANMKQRIEELEAQNKELRADIATLESQLKKGK